MHVKRDISPVVKRLSSGGTLKALDTKATRMSSPLDHVRDPAYTGHNRCWPCTIVNAVILAAIVIGLWARGQRRSALAFGAAGGAAIGLRGYLVPYTPRFAPQLVDRLPWELVPHGGTDDSPGSLADSTGTQTSNGAATPPSGEAVLEALLEDGVVEAAGDEIRLTAAFRTAWREEIDRLRDLEMSDLAVLAEEETPPTVTASTRRAWNRPVIVLERADGPPVTMRRAIAVPEVAASRALESFDTAPEIRRAAGRPLRSLLETCPLCDDEVVVTQATCCGESTPVATTPPEKLMCSSCNERFFVFD